MGEKAKFGIFETWLMPDDELTLWNVASATHELFRFDKSQHKEEKKLDGVMLCRFRTSTKGT